jgi:ParB family chromosome partitioning protein
MEWKKVELKMTQEIEISRLKIHPKNARKTYRNIDELADSIKTRGVLQNLTVVPDPDEDGTYFVVIGNRRLTAARKAGVKTVPCIITEMSEKDQISTMLLENMQRDNLTICEQAQGFQMVLDLGETEEELCEKTGFSKTTIHRRLNIAKLDQELLKEKENDSSFQLTLTDLYMLEQIKDINKRNEILESSRNSKDITWKVQSFVSEEKRNKTAQKLIKMLEGKGVEEAPEGTQYELWLSKWETVKEFDLEKDTPEKIDGVDIDEKEKLYYIKRYRELKVIRKVKKVKKELTPEEILKKKREGRKKKIKEIEDEVSASRKEFILNVISGKIHRSQDIDEFQQILWKVMREAGGYVSNDSLISFFYNSGTYSLNSEQREEGKKKIRRLDITEQMLIAAYNATSTLTVVEWKGTYNKRIADTIILFDQALHMCGFSYRTDEERKIFDGTHELYEKDENEQEVTNNG